MYLQLYFSIFPFALVLIKKIYWTLKTVFDHISKHLEVHKKYSTMHWTLFLMLWNVFKHSLMDWFFNVTELEKALKLFLFWVNHKKLKDQIRQKG